jgi:hypothetical protein
LKIGFRNHLSFGILEVSRGPEGKNAFKFTFRKIPNAQRYFFSAFKLQKILGYRMHFLEALA